MSKQLVAYFSASGVTESAAKTLAKTIGADLYEIKPEIPYSKAGLDWRDKNSRSSVEMNNPDSRPKIADKNANIGEYDTIFVGFPIWWYTAPTIIKTFLESYDFSGKTIVPFATSGGSGLGKTADTLQKTVPSAHVKSGKMLNGVLSADEINKWGENF